MNKKAQGEGFSMMFSLIFLILIITIFWIFSFTDRGVIREETSHQLSIFNINMDLLNLLRTEVDNLTISDLIVQGYITKDYSKLTTEVNDIFSNNFDKGYCWTLDIGEIKIHDVCGGEQITSEIKIPTLNSEDITVKLIRSGKGSKPSYARDKS